MTQPAEPNELDSYSDRFDGKPENTTGLLHDTDPDADRLIEDGRFGEVQHGNQFQEQGCFYNGSLVTDCASVVKAAALQAHSDYCVVHGLPNGSVYASMAQAFKPKDGGQ